MYGYIRPDIGELRINEYRRFRSVYCGLCEALRQRYGILSRFLVSYDMTFLALLTLSPETRIDFRRCPVHPLRKQPCICSATEIAFTLTARLPKRSPLSRIRYGAAGA